jgi:Ca2+ transporting ATPase
MHTKGAAEKIMETCSHFLDQDGKRQELTDQMIQQLKSSIDDLADQALRPIAFAYKDISKDQNGEEHDEKKDKKDKFFEVEKEDATLYAIAGIKDIIRPEVPDAVKMCKGAGVRVRMVTGDNIKTAIAIAKECGIIAKNGSEDKDELVCMEGPKFDEYVGSLVNRDTKEKIEIFGKKPKLETIGKIEEMKKVREKLKVLARSRPNDKYVMVSGLKELGDIVAVTGDGTNDAPALKKANVGFAMKAGTQVAAAASDIIIQDNNFASIVKACKWGRNVYDNIRRFLQFQLTVNVLALVVAFVGGIILTNSPLAAIQFLWVNMIMDTLAALALATESPKDELLKRPPYRKYEYIISQKMVKHILGQTFIQMGFLFAMVFAADKFLPEVVPPTGKVGLNIGPVVKRAHLIPEKQLNPINKAEEEKRFKAAEDYWEAVGIDYKVLKDHENEKYRDWNGVYVLSGMNVDLDGSYAYKPLLKKSKSRHLTAVFNLFVWFQIFNMICARKINDELFVCQYMFENIYFITVWLAIGILQAILIQFSQRVFYCHNKGLTW